MLHAINAWLGRHARQLRDTGLARDNNTAAQHGWQASEIRPGWSYRDPRFGQLATGKAVRLASLVETLLSRGFEVTVADGKGGVRTWTEAALAERISRIQVVSTAADDRWRWSR